MVDQRHQRCGIRPQPCLVSVVGDRVRVFREIGLYAEGSSFAVRTSRVANASNDDEARAEPMMFAQRGKRNMAKPARRQHFIARFYLRNFAEPMFSDNLCVYDMRKQRWERR